MLRTLNSDRRSGLDANDLRYQVYEFLNDVVARLDYYGVQDAEARATLPHINRHLQDLR